jgi:hypothetical protein
VAKLSGYILSIDQASNCAGVSLWRDGALVATTTLVSKSKDDPFSRRVQHQLPQLTAFLDKHLPAGVNVQQVIFEAVRARLVMVVIGAFLVCPRIDAKMSERGSFIDSSTWKLWARKNGAHSQAAKDTKGVIALTETGFDCKKHGITSDDIADSILMFRAWAAR